jgi:hypothetical protein
MHIQEPGSQPSIQNYISDGKIIDEMAEYADRTSSSQKLSPEELLQIHDNEDFAIELKLSARGTADDKYEESSPTVSSKESNQNDASM